MRLLALAALVALAAACGEQPKKPIADLEDPASCMECHNRHYTEWASSMHAYAADDPVFLAMNKRGQRETNGQLGTFCIQCHAPMAVALGLVDDSNAADFDPTALPPQARGITCFFCHDVQKIVDDHNNGLVLAMDDTMRGGVRDPTDSPAHHSAYDPLMDSHTNNSQMCGSCHDVVTPRGIALERTYKEWRSTIFATDDPKNLLPLTCSGCHMQTDTTTSVIADKPGLDVKSRPNSFHEHLWPGIDQALTDFPGMDAQAAGIKRDLDPALTIVGPTPIGKTIGGGGICVDKDNGGEITVRMDTRGVGHMWPSGAAQDRRAWLEVIAYDANNKVVFKSGDVPDGMDPDAINDPYLFGLWDRTVKDDGSPAHFFWEVAQPPQSNLLKPPTTLDPNDPAFDHSSTAVFQIGPQYTEIDHISARVRIRPLGYDILNDLVASGDLDPSIPAKMATLDIAGADRHWVKAHADPSTGCDMNPYE